MLLKIINAKSLEAKGAAIIVTDKNAVSDLVEVALSLLNDNDRRMELGNNIGKMGKPKATEHIANEIIGLVGKE